MSVARRSARRAALAIAFAAGLPALAAHAQGFGTATTGLGLLVDGTCMVGVCPPTPTPLNTQYTLPYSFVRNLPNGDSFRISGTMTSGTINNGSNITNNVIFTVTYLGNTTGGNVPSQTDTLTVTAHVYAVEPISPINAPNPFGVAFSPNISPASSVTEVAVQNGVTYETQGPISPPGPFTAVPVKVISGGQYTSIWTYTIKFGAGSPVGSWIQTGYYVQPPTNILASVLPSARTSSAVTTPDGLGSPGATTYPAVTAFATVINNTQSDNEDCTITLPIDIAGKLSFAKTNPATNAVTGPADVPVSIPRNASQTFVIAITPNAPLSSDLPIQFGCKFVAPATPVIGLNTLLLTASPTPIADMLSIAATPTADGILNIPGTSGATAFGHAAINIASGASVTFTAEDTPIGQPSRNLPVDLTICQTNASGACVNPATPGASATVTAATNQVVTFSVFARGRGQAVPFDPANNRIYVLARQGTTAVGAASVAVRTQ
jgi:hypothetical protein